MTGIYGGDAALIAAPLFGAGMNIFPFAGAVLTSSFRYVGAKPLAFL